MAATLMSTPASHLRCDSPVTSRSSRTLFFLGIFLFILASKFWLIDHFGNGTPYWDQWDGEANGLFIPYLEQRLDWRFFFQPHNEHRIACTKILSLGLLKVNGQWDPRLEMSIQGVIHAATMALLVFLLSFKTSPGHSVGLGIFTAFICAVPVAWENTLWGFQSQFYFVVLWGISGLYFNWRYQTLSRWWLFGCALFAIGLVSMAGGMLAPAAATVLVVSRILTSPRSWPRQLGGAGILGLLCVTGFLLVQHVPGHDSLKAQSAAEMLSSLKSLAAWPLKSWLFAIILQAPFLALGFRAYRRKTTSNDLAWLLTALGTWSMLQMLAISYGRANGGLASRYTDNFSIGLCINAACGLYLLQISRGVFQKCTFAALSLWFALTITGLLEISIYTTPNELKEKKEQSQFQQINTKAYLASGDITHLQGKPWLQIPFPDPNTLARLLDNNSLKSILPVDIRQGIKPSSQGLTQNSFVPNGYYNTTPKRSSDDIWGSFGAFGDATTGELKQDFPTHNRSRWFKISVAGYPLAPLMTFTVTAADGKTINIAPTEDPKESWRSVFFHVPPGPFSIHAADHNSKKWFAFTAPKEVGWASLVNGFLIQNALILLGASIAIICASLLIPQLKYQRY